MPSYRPTYEMYPATAHAPQLAPAAYEHFTLTPLSGALGADIEGVDVAGLGDNAFAEIETALADHLVLFIRGQDLDPDALEAFARRLGPLMQYPQAEPMAGHPMITEFVSRPDSTWNFGGSWHSDSTFLERPPAFTVLHCLDCPEVGGDTSFANQYLAWESLSAGLRRLLADRKAVNSAALSLAGQEERHATDTASGGAVAFKSADAPEWRTENAHPVARTHPVTGRKALYVCDAYTARFEGMSQDESLPILKVLWKQAILPDFTCRFRWRPGTLAIWDNRCTLHFAHNDYPGQRRAMRRVVVEGEAPY